MKRIAILLVFAILISCDLAIAAGYSRSAVIHVTILAPDILRMDLSDDVVSANEGLPQAEAFSDIKEHGIDVDKVKRGDDIVWLFTKTR